LLSVLVAIVSAVVGTLLFARSPRSGRHELVAASIAAVNARSGMVARVQRVPGLPTVVASDGAHVWFGDGRRNVISEVRDDLRTPMRTVRLSTFPYRLVVGSGAAWVADGYEGTVVRIDAMTGRAIRIEPDPHGLGRVQLALGNGALWAASQDGALTRTRTDGSSSKIVATRVGRPEALAYGFGDLWIAEATEDTLLRVSPSDPLIRRRIPIGGIGESIAVGDRSLWVATPEQGTVWRIDPRTSSVVASVRVGGRPTVVIAGICDGVDVGPICVHDHDRSVAVQVVADEGDLRPVR